MATGTPNGKNRNSTASAKDNSFAVSYQDKATEAHIQGAHAAALEQVRHLGLVNAPNRLIFADNARAMRSLQTDLDIAGKVNLVYIDPPYATGCDFESAQVGRAYTDALEGADYLEFLRHRLILLRELMASNGSIYVHLDHNMIFPAKILMDEIFGADAFQNLITRVKCNPKNFTSKRFGDECDYLLFYARGRDYVWNHPIDPWGEDEGAKEYSYVEEGTGRRYKKVPCHLPGVRHGATGSPWRGKAPPPGKHWVHAPEKLDELDRAGRIYWSDTGNPRRKLYLDEAEGKRVANFWTQFRDTQNQSARLTGYPTEKNIEMLSMIVKASSNPGDLVLDAFCGSGSTLAAAAAAGRRWIGIDRSPVAMETALERLQFGTPRMGSYAKSNYLARGTLPLPLPSQVPFQAGGLWIDKGDPEIVAASETLLLKRPTTSPKDQECHLELR